MTHFYLYKITNTVNQKIYIGVHQTSNLDDDYMGSGRYLNNAIIKYGIENFKKEILEYFDSSEKMYEREKEIVNEQFLKRKDVYNINIGGSGSWHNINNSKKNLYGHNGKKGFGGENLLSSDERISLLKERGLYDSYIKNISDALSKRYESGELISIFAVNNPMNSFESKEKQKRSFERIGHQRKEKNSQYGTVWITNEIENRKIKKDDLIPFGWRKGRIL